MKDKPKIEDFTTGGSMVAPHGVPDYKGYARALDEYIEHLLLLRLKGMDDLMEKKIPTDKNVKGETVVVGATLVGDTFKTTVHEGNKVTNLIQCQTCGCLTASKTGLCTDCYLKFKL